jgi:toxin ParE1/3/4
MKIRWTESASENWEQAFDFIAQENSDAALRIAETILDLVEMLAVHPHAGRPGRVAGTRELVVPNSPFLLAYGVDVGDEIVWIYAVYHGRRRWPKSFSKK